MFSKVIRQTIVLALLLFLMSSLVDANLDLAKLCDGNLEISRVSQANALVEASKSTSESSCTQYKNSLAALAPILKQVETGNVCQDDLG